VIRKGADNLNKDCYVNIKNNLLEAKFVGIFQYSHVLETSMLKGGHSGGVIAYPIAIVELNGKFKEVKLSDVTFRR